MSVITVFFDGLCEPTNPGGLGCFGYAIYGLGALDPVTGCGCLAALDKKPMTNNYAEYTALGRAVSLLCAVRARVTADTELVILGDSKLVVEQVNKNWKCEAPALVPLRDAVLEKFRLLGCTWRLEWIPREQNALADGLARAAYTGRTGQLCPERTKS